MWRQSEGRVRVDSFYRGVAIAGAIVVVASVLLTIVRLQGERPFSSLNALLAGVAAAVSLAVYILMLDIALKDAAVVGLLIGGGVLGALVGLKIPLYSRDGIVFSKAAGWHLAPPGLAVAAFQISRGPRLDGWGRPQHGRTLCHDSAGDCRFRLSSPPSRGRSARGQSRRAVDRSATGNCAGDSLS